MQPLQFAVPIRVLEGFAPYIPHVVLAFVLLNMLTRVRAHGVQKREAEDGAETLSRYLPHTVTTVGLILSSFAFLVVHPHGGMVMTVLVVGMFLADFFEFESRQVEARNDLEFERPKSAVVASVVLLLYACFQSLFFLIKPIWSAII